jgi:hypothetical protein
LIDFKILIIQHLFSTKEALKKYTCLLWLLDSKLKDLSVEWKDSYAVHMDNQPPTVWVKKFVFVERLEEQMLVV